MQVLPKFDVLSLGALINSLPAGIQHGNSVLHFGLWKTNMGYWCGATDPSDESVDGNVYMFDEPDKLLVFNDQDPEVAVGMMLSYLEEWGHKVEVEYKI